MERIRISNHFGRGVAKTLKEKFNAEFLDQLNDVTDKEIYQSCRGIGQVTIDRIRELQAIGATNFIVLYELQRAWHHPIESFRKGTVKTAEEWSTVCGVTLAEFYTRFEAGEMSAWFKLIKRPKQQQS